MGHSLVSSLYCIQAAPATERLIWSTADKSNPCVSVYLILCCGCYLWTHTEYTVKENSLRTNKHADTMTVIWRLPILIQYIYIYIFALHCAAQPHNTAHCNLQHNKTCRVCLLFDTYKGSGYQQTMQAVHSNLKPWWNTNENKHKRLVVMTGAALLWPATSWW